MKYCSNWISLRLAPPYKSASSSANFVFQWTFWSTFWNIHKQNQIHTITTHHQWQQAPRTKRMQKFCLSGIRLVMKFQLLQQKRFLKDYWKWNLQAKLKVKSSVMVLLHEIYNYIAIFHFPWVSAPDFYVDFSYMSKSVSVLLLWLQRFFWEQQRQNLAEVRPSACECNETSTHVPSENYGNACFTTDQNEYKRRMMTTLSLTLSTCLVPWLASSNAFKHAVWVGQHKHLKLRTCRNIVPKFWLENFLESG